MNMQILEMTIMGQRFLKGRLNGRSVDLMIAYKNKLNEHRTVINFPDIWFQNEIDAIDEIISAARGNIIFYDQKRGFAGFAPSLN